MRHNPNFLWLTMKRIYWLNSNHCWSDQSFAVVTALEATTALRLIEQEQPDLVILDILLPKTSGRDILRQLRQNNNWVPVILLTQVSVPMERIVSLQEGADDYINKPFDPYELVARIQAVLRRASLNARSITDYQKLTCNDLTLNRMTRQAMLEDRPLTLTARPLQCLNISCSTRVRSLRGSFTRSGVGWSDPIESRAVDIRVAEVRKALNDTADHPRYIETVVGRVIGSWAKSKRCHEPSAFHRNDHLMRPASTHWLGGALQISRSEQAGTLLHIDLAFDVAGLASRLGIGISLVLFLVFGLWVGVRWRLSGRVAAVQQAAQSAHDLDRRHFLQRLDHELKNPLAIIHLGLVNLHTETSFSPEQTASLARIEAQTARLEKLVTDLRRLAELESTNLEKSLVDLHELITDLVESSMHLHEGKTIDLSFQEVPWRVGVVMGDPDLLMIAFRNLIDNALKFTDDNGHVEVRLTDDSREVSFEVADNGMGIPEDEIDDVDKELYRGRNAKRVVGSGLGLTLVKRIFDLHHFTMTVRSREGQGTIVQVRMPLAARTNR
jgi:two-component system OmpR family sensor kinase